LPAKQVGPKFGVSAEVTTRLHAHGTRLAYLALCGMWNISFWLQCWWHIRLTLYICDGGDIGGTQQHLHKDAGRTSVVFGATLEGAAWYTWHLLLQSDRNTNTIADIQIIVKEMSCATSYCQLCSAWWWSADLPTSVSSYQMGRFSISGTLTDVTKSSKRSNTGKSCFLLSMIHSNNVVDFGNHTPDQRRGISFALSPQTFTEIQGIICHPLHSG
jgi:hypothetical protein